MLEFMYYSKISFLEMIPKFLQAILGENVNVFMQREHHLHKDGTY